MAKADIVDVGTITVGGITVKRWWRSLEVWNGLLNIVVSVSVFLIGIAAIAAPVVLEYLDQLGISPFRAMLIGIVAKVVIEINQLILKFRSTSMIGNKADVSIAKETTTDQTEVGPH